MIENSKQVFQLIEQMAADSSKNGKQALLSSNSGSSFLRDVLELCYSPLITYGIAKMPPRDKDGTALWDETTFSLIDDLRERRLTGNSAKGALQDELNRLEADSAELLRRVLLKDMRAGFSDSTTNKAFKGLIPKFPYMRCCLPKDTDMSTWDWARGAYSQEKADGMFCNINNEVGGNVVMSSRQGTLFPMDEFGPIVEFFREHMKPGTQTHGELLVRVDGVIAERQISNGILNSIVEGGKFAENQQPVYLAWDQIPLSAVVPKGKLAVTYDNRLLELRKQLWNTRLFKDMPVRLIETRVVHSIQDAYQHCKELLLKGKEGTIVSNAEGMWRDGDGKDKVKLKLEFPCDLQVVSINEGEGKNTGRPGALVMKTSDDKLLVNVTVKNEAMREDIERDPARWIGKIMTVRSNLVLKPSESNELHSLFLPRFVEGVFRLDKSEADDLEQVFAQQQAAIDCTAALDKAA